ncbi:unnamed protein product, partial [Allacma fusca]
WLNWHQSFGGSNGYRIGTSIRHTMDLNHHVGFKNLVFDLSLNRINKEDPFQKLVIIFRCYREGICGDEKSSHYHYLQLDRCAVRISLKGPNVQDITRWVHIDCKKVTVAKDMAASMILATYEDPYFISEDALKGLRGDGVILPTEELGEIEICGHLEICCYCWKSTQLMMRIFDGIDQSCVQVKLF